MSTRRRSAHYLSAAVAGGLISFLALPVITRRLGPVEFGAAALVTAFVSLGNAFATLGSSFVVYRFLPEEDESDKALTIASLCVLASLASVAWAAVLAGVFFSGISFAGLDRVPSAGVVMSIAAMLLSPYWSIATDVLILEGRSATFAWATVTQALVGTAATIVALFVFDAGVVALFAGNLAAMVVVGTVGLWTLRRYITVHPTRRSLAKVFKVAVHNLPSQAAESGYLFAERVLISRFAGFRGLGLYSHSQRYREIAQLGLKSVARGLWPVSLDEARDPTSNFVSTERAWTGLHVVLTAVGIGAAAIGDHVISAITNGRFTDSYLLVAGWVAYVLIQNSARPQLATLFALGESDVVARANLRANLIGLIALVVGVPLLGVGGGLAAGLSGIVVSRGGFMFAARRYRATPNQDRWVVLGALLIGATALAKVSIAPSFWGSVALLAGAEAVCLGFGFRPLVDLSRSALRIRT